MLLLLCQVEQNKLGFECEKGMNGTQLQGYKPALCDGVHITENMYTIGTLPPVFNCTPLMTLKTTGVEETVGCCDVRTSNET